MAPDDAVTESVVIRLDRRKHTVQYQAGRHDPRDRPARRAAAAVLVRAGQLRDVHGASRRRHGDDARQQRAVGRRPRGRLDPHVPVAPDERARSSSTTTPEPRARDSPARLRARDRATRGTPRCGCCDSMRASRSGPSGSTRTARSVTPGVAEAAQPLRRPPARRRRPGGRRRRSRRRARAGAGSSASTRRARAPGSPSARAVVDLVVAAQRDRDAGDDARRRAAGRRRRPS